MVMMAKSSMSNASSMLMAIANDVSYEQMGSNLDIVGRYQNVCETTIL